jgi:predicted DNA-binding protein with PD1-like motif
MKTKLLAKAPKIWMVVFAAGEEASAGLLDFARHEKLDASHFTGIGAFSSAELGYFDIQKGDYECIPISEQTEVLSFLGDITLGEEGPKIHAHVVLGKRDGSAWGGHLLKGFVRPTLELVVTESPAHLRRRHDAATGLALIDPSLGP